MGILRKFHFLLTVQILKWKIGHFNFKMVDLDYSDRDRLELNFIFHVKIFEFDENKVP